MSERWCSIGAVLVLSVFTTACRTEIVSDLEETGANEIILALSQAGIEGQKERSGSGRAPWSVNVPREVTAMAYQVMQDSSLPRPRHDGFRAVYKERGLVPGRLEERALFASALQEEIAATLESVSGVFSARVHTAIQMESRGRKQQAQPASASVLISYLGDVQSVPPISPGEVQTLVANSVAGLSPQRVVVVFSARKTAASVNGRVFTPGSDDHSWIRILALAVAAIALFGGLALFFLRRHNWSLPLLRGRA